ncbi:MAG: hypothetical protein Fur0032_23500 [Terrimicrobiaceae bacterium]
MAVPRRPTIILWDIVPCKSNGRRGTGVPNFFSDRATFSAIAAEASTRHSTRISDARFAKYALAGTHSGLSNRCCLE